MTLHFKEFPKGAWVRTCQECGHKQSMKSPAAQVTDGWRDAKCRNCKSEALDYGQENTEIHPDYEDE